MSILENSSIENTSDHIGIENHVMDNTKTLLSSFENKKYRGNVALFIDNDNLFKSGRDAGIPHGYNFDYIVEKSKEYGCIVQANAYGNLQRVQYELFKRGINPIYTPSITISEDGENKYKSLADPMIICDIISTLYERPDIETFIIASGDKDFIPVLFNLYKHKKNVIVMGFEETTARDLIEVIGNFGFKFLDYKLMGKICHS